MCIRVQEIWLWSFWYREIWYEQLWTVMISCAYQNVQVHTYILLTKREGRSGRISVRGVDSMDRCREIRKTKTKTTDRRPIFFWYGLEQTWLIRNLLHDLCYPKIFKSDLAWSFEAVSGPILREYWTDNGAIWLFYLGYWPSELT